MPLCLCVTTIPLFPLISLFNVCVCKCLKLSRETNLSIIPTQLIHMHLLFCVPLFTVSLSLSHSLSHSLSLSLSLYLSIYLSISLSLIYINTEG